MRTNADIDFPIADQDTQALRSLDGKDYGDSSVFPV
jgi:hypothetical protein